jgi:hypothetical protein
MVMKYYSELSQIETQIIRLSAMSSVLRVISIGAEQANAEDVRNALWYIEGSVEDIHDCLNARFNDLWEEVRNESFDEESEKLKERHKGGMKKKKMMTDRELP